MKLNITCIPGDGIGPEIVTEAKKVLEKVAEVENLQVSAEEIEEEYKKAAETYNVDVERVKSTVASDVIERDLKLRKAADLIAESGVAVEKAESTEAEGEAKPEAGEEAEKKPAKKSSVKKPAKKEDPKSEDEPKPAEE